MDLPRTIRDLPEAKVNSGIQCFDFLKVGLNQAFALFKAGKKDVRFIAVAGKDADWIIEDLHNEGFNIDDIIIHPTMVLAHSFNPQIMHAVDRQRRHTD